MEEDQTQRISAKGKFFYHGAEKFYLKGVTYGTFKPQENDVQYPEREVMARDLHGMATAGFNCVRTYTVPPLYFLDAAAEAGLKVMVGLPWEQHITFLDDSERRQDIIRRVREAANSCKQHPAILCYAIGNEIPGPIARWYGKGKIEGFLKQLYRTVKSVDPRSLVTYVNYPTTEYLNLSFLDFNCFNVYLETPEKLGSYLARLHNLSGDRPLVLAEIGLDSMRNGADKQAEVLAWQIKTIFSKGSAGMFVFAWTDEWWRGGFEIEDWDFGIVDRARRPKPALAAVSDAMKKVPVSEEAELPFISIVVCSYNGSATIRDTLDGVLKLDYPAYEVIVVNDGSCDALADIVSEYPVKLISTPNRGLSSARNTGMLAARGEIVAYIDDDAYPDQHWLRYLAYAYMHSSHAGIGGPNIAPPEDGPIGQCVANAPGGPVHVLLSDEVAEHIPGCNMSFRKSALLAAGGFDPIYRAAGDDVDMCWRIQDLGYTIGFHPSACVWHHRRNSIRMYWRQQQGYGKAEALLESKWPERYNALGHVSWGGRMYGYGVTLPIKWKRDRVFHGTWGSALFQSVYQRTDSFWATFSLMPEWYLFTGVLGIFGLMGFVRQPLLWTWLLFAASIVLVVAQAVRSAMERVSLPSDKRHSIKYRLLIIYLHLLQPLARLSGRIKHGLTPWRKRGAGIGRFLFRFTPITFTHWSEEWHSSEEWLTDLTERLAEMRISLKKGGSFHRWDLQLRTGPLAKARCLLTIEEHGAKKQLLRVKCWSVFPFYSVVPMIILTELGAAAFIADQWIVSTVFTVLAMILFLRALMEAASAINSVKFACGNLTGVSCKRIVHYYSLAEGQKPIPPTKHLVLKKKQKARRQRTSRAAIS